MIYQDVHNQKLPWDAELTKQLVERVKNWEQTLPTDATVPRSVLDYRESVLDFELHAFGDASTQGVGAAAYAVVWHPSGIMQHPVEAKGSLAKQGLTVPHLELISTHMVTNLMTNFQNTLNGLPNPRVYAWLGSTVALHWILSNGQYKQFTNESKKFTSARRLNGDVYQHMMTQLI